MRQLSTKVQLKWMYAIIGKCRNFNNEKHIYPKVGYKRPQHEENETIQLRKLTA